MLACPLDAIKIIDLCPELESLYEYQNFQYEYGISKADFVSSFREEVDSIVYKWWRELDSELRLEYVLLHMNNIESKLNNWKIHLKEMKETQSL